MRRAAKVDANQAEIVEALRRIGARVTPLHMVGGGVPDLLVEHRNRIFLVEVKDGRLPPSARLLTPEQAKWHREAQVKVHIVTSVEQALEVVR